MADEEWLMEGTERHDGHTAVFFAAGRIERGVDWLIARTETGRGMPATPIGLYYAKLWYCERLYPLIFLADALNRRGCHHHPVRRSAGRHRRDRQSRCASRAGRDRHRKQRGQRTA